MKITIKQIKELRNSLVFKLIFTVDIILLLIIAWVYFYIRHQNDNVIGITLMAVFLLLAASSIIFVFVSRFVSLPIKGIITVTNQIAKGNYFTKVDINQENEIGELASAINQMGDEIGKKQDKLNRQRNEYRHLFDQVPCLITVQDKSFRLIEFNREFSEKFSPEPGDYCFHAYKGRNKKCEICPVEKTFQDGNSHYGEETGTNKDGAITHWIVKTSPIRNYKGEIVAAVEMSLDITHNRQLEEKLEESERKYQEIFNNIPNPIFVLDEDNLEILDCNQSVKNIYGYAKNDIIGESFLDLFKDEEKERYASNIKESSVLNQVPHLTEAGNIIYVDIWISPSEYTGQKVFLVTTSDITQRLKTEQQLIQASKMATLGEMASGIAHELNQPLSVIKTASSFCIKKANKKEKVDDETLFNMLKKIDSNIDRANKIITHMRQFARKTDLLLEKVQVNEILEKSFEIFSQQLRLRGIEVVWEIEKDLPLIMGIPDRMEQVFINLLINARDTIEEKWGNKEHKEGDKRITLRTWSEGKDVLIDVCDTGSGIPEAISDRIFEPFFTTKEVGKGTGLGLSISYSIVKDCGGTIQIKSSSEEGTCFNLRFPVMDEE